MLPLSILPLVISYAYYLLDSADLDAVNRRNCEFCALMTVGSRRLLQHHTTHNLFTEPSLTISRSRKPAPKIVGRQRPPNRASILKRSTAASLPMVIYRKPAPKLLGIPAEIIDLIARNIFRGQVIRLRDPEEVGNAELLALTNPLATILCIEGVVGRRATEVMLQEAFFTFTNVHILSTHRSIPLKQLFRIHNLGITVFDMGMPSMSHYLSRLTHLKRLALTMDWCDMKNAPPSEITRGWMLSLCRGLRLGSGDIMGARRILWEEGRTNEVELRIAVHRGPINLFNDLNVIDDGGQEPFKGCPLPKTCEVVLAGERVVNLDAGEGEDGEGWRRAVERDFRLAEGA